MNRLLVEPALLDHDDVTPPRDAERHLKVLRVKPGEAIELFDGHGRLRTYTVAAGCRLAASGPVRSVPRPRTELVLFACVTKGSRWDWTIEKATELGAARIVPVISDRTIVRLDAAERPAKAERWRRVAEDAARQSDAAWLPEVLAPVDFKDSLALLPSPTFVGALVTPPPPLLLAALAGVPACARAAIYVGPEGDFTPDELRSLIAAGAVPVSFGPTVLRAETAAIFGLSVLAAARA